MIIYYSISILYGLLWVKLTGDFPNYPTFFVIPINNLKYASALSLDLSCFNIADGSVHEDSSVFSFGNFCL